MKTVSAIKEKKVIQNMRAILKSQSTRNELLFILGINVGIRISDILQLKKRDLVNEKGLANKSVNIKEKKTGKTKKFYIGDIVKKTIETYYKNNKADMDTYVFKSRQRNNKPISRQQAHNILNGAAEQLGIVQRDKEGHIVRGEIGTHTLRKTFGYHAYQNGVALELLMKIFNHSSKSDTLRYIGITDDDIEDVYLKSNLG